MDGMIFPWIFVAMILDMSFSNKIDETLLLSQSSTEAAVPSKFMLSDGLKIWGGWSVCGNGWFSGRREIDFGQIKKESDNV